MAASSSAAAAGRAWSRIGVTGVMNPNVGNFHRQIHRRCLRVNAPFSPHRHPLSGSYAVLLRPAIRCQSTATVAGTQVVQPIVSPPIEASLPTADLGQAVQELSFAELGLGAHTPVGLIQNLLECLHVDVGLPWWGAIVAGTVVARCLVFPLIVKGQREAVKLNNHLPQITQLTTRMNEAKQSGNKFEFAKAYSDLALYQKTHNVNPLRGFLVPLVQAPIFISFFIALRKMAELPVPSMQTGGLWWFADLTAADPYYILPLAVTVTMWAILELGAESGVSNPNLRVMKTVFRVMPIAILPLTISFPTAIFTYWMTSNLFSLVQVGVLRLPAVRTRLRIPERVEHDPADLPPQEGFVKSLKKGKLAGEGYRKVATGKVRQRGPVNIPSHTKLIASCFNPLAGWKNAQLAQQLEERERRIKNHLDLAAKGRPPSSLVLI
uniref:OXA1L mitochondrial inner membrane protein n=1 Tax=Anolis carolinensis TaxID=28377 RepID=A0A803SLA0_ANOCA